MKTKLEMAHEWYMKYSESPSFMNTEVEMAWQYADAMQAEADKRENKETCDKSLNIDSKELNVEDWQPDWSQAPSDALTWAINGKGDATWALYENGEFYSCVEAPSFGYTGDWRDSLRKRPK